MLSPRLPKVEAIASDVVHDLRSLEPGGIIQISGSPSSGKTALLRRVAQTLTESVRTDDRASVPVVISPPARFDDTGFAAVIEGAAQLHRGKVINGAFETLTKRDVPVSWSESLELFRGWLEKNPNVVLLCDDPSNWSREHADNSRFNQFALDVANLLLASPCRKVVATTRALGGGRRAQRFMPLAPQSDPSAWLADSSDWGSLAAAARAVADLNSQRLVSCSPLELRLLVALVAFDEQASAREWLASSSHTRVGLANRVRTTLERKSPSTLEVWRALSLLRRPFNDKFLSVVGGEKLDSDASGVLRHCLLYQDEMQGKRWVLHEMLRMNPESPHKTEADRELHARFAEGYHAEFVTGPSTEDGAVAEIEAFHHATEAENSAVAEKLTPLFVEQFQLLGRAWSLRGRRLEGLAAKACFTRAAKAYERSLQWKDDDDYAHHWYAFNVDVTASDWKRALDHYRRAVEILPASSRWQSSLIQFLIERARFDDARAAWNQAIDHLAPYLADESIYEELHLPVARALIHRAQLDDARRVLNAVRTDVDSRDVRVLRSRLEALEEAQDGRAFVPFVHLRKGWMGEGPFLLPKTRNGKALNRWFACRIEAVEGDDISLRFAVIEGGMLSKVLTATYSRGQLAKLGDLALDEGYAQGRFLEMASYGVEKQPSLSRIHNLSKEDPFTSPAFPPFDRYLRPGM